MSTTVVNATASNGFSSFFSTIGSTFQHQVLPCIVHLASRTQSAWQGALPYIEKASKYLTTRFGTGALCLATSISFFAQARRTQHLDKRITAIMLGVTSLFFGSYLVVTQFTS